MKSVRPDSTGPDPGLPIRSLAQAGTSREVLQLMLTIKNRLSDYEISIPVTAPDAYAQLLWAGSGIQDEDLQDLIHRLRESDPPTICVYQFSQAEGLLMCARCGQMLTLQIPARATVSAPITSQCPSCRLPFAVALASSVPAT